MDALATGIKREKVNWVLDADIRDFFTSLDQSWLVRFLEHRIADKRILRLIQKWLGAGVIENGEWSKTEQGTAQGASVSPLLANVYLHYVFDLWAHQWRRRHAHGDVILTRFADDYIAGFEHRDDAERFLADLRERFAKFGLELHPEKTRLIEFGRFAAQRRQGAGLGKPETVRVPGLHARRARRAGTDGSRSSASPSKKRMRAKLSEVKTELTQTPASTRSPNKDAGLPASSAGTATTTPCRATATRSSRSATRRPGTGTGRSGAAASATALNWERMHRIATRWLPPARVTHPDPRRAIRRQNPREEPSAVVPLAGICAGGGQQWPSLPRLRGQGGDLPTVRGELAGDRHRDDPSRACVGRL